MTIVNFFIKKAFPDETIMEAQQKLWEALPEIEYVQTGVTTSYVVVGIDEVVRSAWGCFARFYWVEPTMAKEFKLLVDQYKIEIKAALVANDLWVEGSDFNAAKRK